MTDRHTYRVWDTLRREYLSAGKVMIQVNAKNYPEKSALFLDGDKYECDDRMVLEQCTGLKDRNDKLIYEGDILQHPISKETFSVRWFKAYSGLRAYYNDFKDQNLGMQIGDKGLAVVISTIHKNHEITEMRQK